ncbi:hypothetical protein ACFL27_19955, partial [candidate division CSSED10-310 bacterium]
VTIDGVKPGNNYHIHAEALDPDNQKMCEGDSQVFNAVAGETAVAGHIDLDCLIITFEKTFGGTETEWSLSVQQTTDSGYIIAGTTDSYGAGMSDVYLIKTDENGTELWSRTYGGSNIEFGGSVQQTTDGGYIIAADTYSFGAGAVDVYLLKTDENGNELWSQTFGGIRDDDWGYSVLQTADGGYIFAGTTKSFGAGNYDIYLLKTDGNGAEVWFQTFGGTEADIGSCVQQTAEGGFIVVGSSASFGAGADDVYLIKTDGNGTELWSQTFGGIQAEYGGTVQQTADRGFIIAGSTASYGAGADDVYLLKTDENGNELWSQTFGGTGIDHGSWVQQTTAGGYIITGTTTSIGAGEGDVYLLKTNGTGTELWSRTFGGTGSDRGSSVQQTADGGYIISGTTASYGAGDSDIYLIKTDSQGELWFSSP